MTPEELATAGLRYDVSGAVATVTMSRPEVRNAQTPRMWAALAAIGDEIPDEVRVVVIRGEGRSFSAGLDRAMLDPAKTADDPESVIGLLKQSDEQVMESIDRFQQGFTWLRDPRFTSIAAVQGHAIGAGFQLALSCDLRIAADDAKFCMKEPALGLVPDLTGTKPLVDLVGLPRAIEICLTTRTVLADEALALGIAQQVVPGTELSTAVQALVDALLAVNADAARATKALLQAASSHTLEEQALLERQAQTKRILGE